MKRQNFCSQVIQKSEGAHRDKELLILCNSAIMEIQNMYIRRRGQWPISLLLGETICHVKEQDCRKVARPCLVLVRISSFPMVCIWGPRERVELRYLKTRISARLPIMKLKGIKNKIRNKKKLLQTIGTDVQERSQEKKVYRNMGTDPNVCGTTGQLESH